MIHIKVMDPILQSETLFFVCGNPDEVIKQARNDYNILLCEEDFQGTRGFFRRLSNDKEEDQQYTWFIWVKDPDLRLIVHEATHLVFDLLLYHNIEYSDKTEEVFCHYFEYFVYQFWAAALKDIKVKKKE